MRIEIAAAKYTVGFVDCALKKDVVCQRHHPLRAEKVYHTATYYNMTSKRWVHSIRPSIVAAAS